MNTKTSSPRRIDAFSHFSPGALLDFMEKHEGQEHGMHQLFGHKSTLTKIDDRIKLLDDNEIDIDVLIPLPWLETAPKVCADARLASEAARICNEAIAGDVAKYPSRFAGVALLATNSAEAMVAELERAVSKLGFVGGLLPVGPTAKRMDHPDMEAVFKRAAELDVPLWLHPSRPMSHPNYIDEQMSQFLDWQMLGWVHDTSTAMIRIVFAGVFDRYPNLKIITHHHGGLVPLFAKRMQEMWEMFEKEAGLVFPTNISKPYIDHFRKFYCDTATFGYEPKLLEIALEFFGRERMLFGSDTPMDNKNGSFFTSCGVKTIAGMAVDDATKNLIFSGNALRILKLRSRAKQ